MTVRFSLKASHPCRPGRACPPRQGGEPPFGATPCDFGSPRGSPCSPGEDASCRLLQPTYDTSTREAFDSRAAACAARPRGSLADRDRFLPCGARPPCDDPAPVGCAFDGAHPASVTSPMMRSPGPFDPRSAKHRAAVATSPRCFRPSATLGSQPLTLPVAPRRCPGTGRLRGARTASTTPSSKGAAFPARSAFPRQVFPRGCSRSDSDFGGNPPPISRLCHRRSGFRRAFVRRCSRSEGLDPRTVPRSLRPRAPRATCRLSTSATDTFREHDLGSPNSARPPQRSPAEAATSRELDLSIALPSCGWRRSSLGRAQPAENSRVRGLCAEAFTSLRQRLPSRSLATGTSPQPDRPGHLLSLTRCGTGWRSLFR